MSVGSAEKDGATSARTVRRRASWPAGLILTLVTVALDAWGLGWGLPSSAHLRSYHPDEWRVIEAAERMDPLHGSLTPGFYNYGSLYVDSLYIAYNLAGAFGVLDPHPDPRPMMFHEDNARRIYLTSRVVTLLFSMATVLMTWRVGSRLFGATTGFLGALLLTVTPLFVIYSHYAAVDVPATCWVMAALWGCAVSLDAPVRLARAASGKVKRPAVPPSLYLAAVAAGLATGTKYNSGLVLAAVFLAWGWRVKAAYIGEKSRLHVLGDLVYGWLVLATVAFGVFLMTTPGFLLEPKLFWVDFTYELKHSSTGHGYAFTDTPPGFWYHIVPCLWNGLGPPLLALCLAGVVLALVIRTRSDALLASTALPYYLVIGVAQVKFMRYDIPLLPILCLWAARLMVASWRSPENTPAKDGRKNLRLRRAAAAAVSLFAAVFALAQTGAYDRVLAARDVRDRAETWILSHIPSHDTVGLVDTPWFDTPPIIFPNVHLTTAEIEQRQEEWRNHLEIVGWNAARLNLLRPRWIMITEWQQRYLVRIHALDPGGTSLAARDAARAWEFLKDLERGYRLAATFRVRPHLGLVDFEQGFVPEDWIYPNPTIWIYERRPENQAPSEAPPQR